MMRNTAISFTVCVTDAGKRLQNLIDALTNEFNVQLDQDLELITIRHHHNADIRQILGSRTVIFEERVKDTLQMVVKRTAGIKRKVDK
jgi:aspartate kinase